MKLLPVCFAAFLLTLALAPTSQADPLFVVVLTLQGVEGESQIPGYENQIDVATASFSSEQFGFLGKDAAKTGAGVGKAVFAPIVISKGPDKSSPILFLRSITGKTFAKAKISFLSQSDGPSSAADEFFSITLGDVIVTKYSVSGSRAETNGREEVVLNYSKIFMKYTPFLPGGGHGGDIKAGFDLKTNKEISGIP